MTGMIRDKASQEMSNFCSCFVLVGDCSVRRGGGRDAIGGRQVVAHLAPC